MVNNKRQHEDDKSNTIDKKANVNKTGKGLDVELHPLLKNFNTPSTFKSNKNPIKQNSKKWFDPTAFNPYINQTNSIPSHKPKKLNFNNKGKYIEKGNKFRENLKIENEERKLHEELAEKGLIPDKSVGEDLYQPEYPPLIEWWDRPYLRDNNYLKINDDSRIILENEEQPITIYIQHPVLIPPIWNNPEQNQLKPMFLTKKERKRIRKNDRQIKHKEKQDRIKLGLEPPPPPKVKLSNLMNVLTNESIRDPTAVENKVKQEIEERLQKHLADNEARKLTKDEKNAKIYEKQEKDLAKGIFSTVYKIDNLDNPSHAFKVDKNATQHNLYGICLKNPEFNLIIVEGGEKSIKQYKKLLMNRIKWEEVISNEGEDEAMIETSNSNKSNGDNDDDDNDTKNSCKIIWEGQLPDVNFQKWSIMYSRNDDEAMNVLKKFKLENYWRLAKTYKSE
ncbi:PRP3 [Candida jiufengensis]|uniref:PRP3 n=1 Tax=Candida jiufengensis TaxID=497108 RepID=UPI0022252F83|nr:PRP3 [Candida jiufengensis]KAI5951780.1 PRP3 [Candida jiufengensis]